jgi:signal transduction histidine kinase
LRSLAQTDAPQRAADDLNEVICELSELIRSDAKSHGVTYRLELSPDLPQVTIDRAQIQQVVLNLVRNALEALAMGQLDAREVIVRTRLTDVGEVEISVCDNGPGVGAIADRMFDPFCSTKATGTGLGLPISRTIVQTHNGTLGYQPNSPRGACFTVRLPSTQRRV